MASTICESCATCLYLLRSLYFEIVHYVHRLLIYGCTVTNGCTTVELLIIQLFDTPEVALLANSVLDTLARLSCYWRFLLVCVSRLTSCCPEFVSPEQSEQT